MRHGTAAGELWYEAGGCAEKEKGEEEEDWRR